MTSQPSDTTVAIVMATYNGARFLQEQLDSIANQTYTDWRLLIRDDGSSDETVDIIERAAHADPRIELIRDNDGNLGPSLNFSALCEIARARAFDYVFFADQDDVWHSDKLAVSLESLQAEERRTDRTRPILIHSDLVVIDKRGAVLDSSLMHYKGFHHVDDHPLRVLLVQNFVTGCSVACNQALVQLATPVPSVAQMHDYWYALCAATFGELAYLPRPTLNYRQHSANNLGARRRTILPSSFHLGPRRAWQNGITLLEERITQARELHKMSCQHPNANADAQKTLDQFLNIFQAPTRGERLLRASHGHIHCQRGIVYNTLLYLQIFAVPTRRQI